MTRPWVPGVLIVGALALVASLYLPWQELRCEWTPLRVLQCGLGSNVDGWSTGLGAPTALLAVLVVALAAASFVRPQAFAAPLGQCALTAGYFGIALAVRAPLNARQEGRLLHGHFHLTYGTYLGIA